MVIRFGPLMTSVVLMLALVKLLAEAAVNQTEVGDAMIEQAERDRKSTRLNSSHVRTSRMPSSA